MFDSVPQRIDSVLKKVFPLPRTVNGSGSMLSVLHGLVARPWKAVLVWKTGSSWYRIVASSDRRSFAAHAWILLVDCGPTTLRILVSSYV